MPLPKRQKNENRQKFISRCMSDEKSKQEFPDNKQRLGMCMSNASEHHILCDMDEYYYTSTYGYTELLDENNYIDVNDNDYIEAELEEDIEEIDLSVAKPGLWENIRKKKEREGKKYRPAKPGDKDRPDKEAWKKAQSKQFKYKDPQTGEIYIYDRPGTYKKNGRYLIRAAEYQGRKVTLNKPFRTSDGPKKFAVYTKNEKGNVVIVRFGDPNMKIKKNIPERRKSFRARHNCDNPGPKWKARYWSCKAW